MLARAYDTPVSGRDRKVLEGQRTQWPDSDSHHWPTGRINGFTTQVGTVHFEKCIALSYR